MNFNNLFDRTDDDRAVSPVIGVILMVAITVILAAVIGTFVLDLGSNVGDSAPQASLAISDHNDDYDTAGTGDQNAFRINHDGGEDLAFDQLRIEVRNASDNALQLQFDGDTVSTTNGDADGNITLNGGSASSTDLMSTGDQMVIVDDGTPAELQDGTQYRIIFIDLNGGEQVAAGTVTLR